MAILNQIRSKKIVLILVIALALLAFVIGADSMAGGGSETTSVIGEVNGEVISRDDFVNQVEFASGRAGANASTVQVVNQVWQSEVRREILNQQYDKLGLNVEKDQILNVIKANPAIASDPIFQNEAGVFDEQKVIDFVRELKTNNSGGYLSGKAERYEQWLAQEDALINASKENSYFNLIKAGVGATIKEGEAAYHLENDKIDIKYVQVPYSSVPDSVIQVTDKEVEAYIKENKEDFEEEAYRSIRFVYFEEKSSEEDEQKIKDDLTALLNSKVSYNAQTKANDTVPGFDKATNIQEYVNAHSDVKYDSTYIVKKDLPSAYADTLYNLNVGDVYGPYKDGDFYKLSRMINKGRGSVKASHILISYDGVQQAQPKEPRTKEEAEALANEILDKAKKDPDSFSDLAKEYSEDPGSANKGGQYDDIARGMMVPAFDEYVFSSEVGEIGIVETTFGYHVLKVDDTYEGVQLATIARKIDPSEETVNSLYNSAVKFEMAAVENDFTEAAEAEGYTVRPISKLQAMDENIPGVGNNRGLVQWTFNADTDVNDIKRFNMNNGYIIAQVTGKYKKGTASVNSARIRVLPILRKQKKAALIKSENEGKSLEEIVSSNGLEKIKTTAGLNMKSPTITGAGREPKVVGTAFSLEEGEVSNLIEGENGVYKVEVTNKEIAPSLDNYTTYANTQKTLNRNRAMSAAYNALKEEAEIEDNRANFY